MYLSEPESGTPQPNCFHMAERSTSICMTSWKVVSVVGFLAATEADDSVAGLLLSAFFLESAFGLAVEADGGLTGVRDLDCACDLGCAEAGLGVCGGVEAAETVVAGVVEAGLVDTGSATVETELFTTVVVGVATGVTVVACVVVVVAFVGVVAVSVARVVEDVGTVVVEIDEGAAYCTVGSVVSVVESTSFDIPSTL